MRVHDQSFHWFVGILEGEGTFCAAAPSSPGLPYVRLVMTDRDIVERIGSLFGRAVIPLRPKAAHHKIPFATTIKGSGAVELMRAVRPHMSDTRATQIDRALGSWHGRPRRSSPIQTQTLRFPIIDVHECERPCAVAWVAGLLEGEGTFGINRSGRSAYPKISVEMCDEKVVQRAAATLGAARVWPDMPRDASWRVSYTTAVTGHLAAEWMRRLRPLMGERRRQAIDDALAAYRPIRLADVPATCVVPGCGAPHRSRGLCHKHYMAWSRDVAKGRTPRVTPLR